MSFISLAGQDLAIDLGTTNTLVYKKNKGVVLNEPSRIAIDINNGQIVGIGENAYEMEGKSPANIRVYSALEDGVIRDYEITRALLTYFIEKSTSGVFLLSPRIVVVVPSILTDVERRAVEDAGIQAGARDVLLIEESLATVAGKREDVFEASGNLAINFGGGLTEIGLISLGRIVSSNSVKIGGESINRDIRKFIVEEKGLLVAGDVCEQAKLYLANLSEDAEGKSFEFVGRDVKTGLPGQASITTNEVNSIIKENLALVIEGLNTVLERTPPGLTNSIMEKGILISGGSSRIRGLEPYLREHIDLDIEMDEEPMTSTVAGSGKFIDKFSQVKKSRIIKYS